MVEVNAATRRAKLRIAQTILMWEGRMTGSLRSPSGLRTSARALSYSYDLILLLMFEIVSRILSTYSMFVHPTPLEAEMVDQTENVPTVA